MNRLATRLVFWSLFLPACSGTSARGQQSERPGGFTPEEAVRRMVVPPGFHVEVFAAEPMVRQPVTACFDERGRLWVVEYLQYPNPAGLKPVTVDQYLRTEYDRVPEPPPRGPRGADRIKVLEDTDGDGRADSVKVFAEGLNLASALAVGHGGVFVGQAPYLLFYPDRNHDDRPDGDPEVLLAGFGLQDAHATVNSMTWGPDGWLYGAQGSTVTARIRGQEFQQAIWRIIPATAGSRSSRRGAAIPGASISTRPATPSAAATAPTSRSTWSRAVIISRASPSTARCTTPAPTAISARSTTAGPSSAATSRRAGSSTRGTPSPRVPRGVHRRQPAVQRRVLARPRDARARRSPAGTAGP